jgi:hypothetical protein
MVLGRPGAEGGHRSRGQADRQTAHGSRRRAHLCPGRRQRGPPRAWTRNSGPASYNCQFSLSFPANENYCPRSSRRLRGFPCLSRSMSAIRPAGPQPAPAPAGLIPVLGPGRKHKPAVEIPVSASPPSGCLDHDPRLSPQAIPAGQVPATAGHSQPTNSPGLVLIRCRPAVSRSRLTALYSCQADSRKRSIAVLRAFNYHHPQAGR